MTAPDAPVSGTPTPDGRKWVPAGKRCPTQHPTRWLACSLPVAHDGPHEAWQNHDPKGQQIAVWSTPPAPGVDPDAPSSPAPSGGDTDPGSDGGAVVSGDPYLALADLLLAQWRRPQLTRREQAVAVLCRDAATAIRLLTKEVSDARQR